MPVNPGLGEAAVVGQAPGTAGTTTKKQESGSVYVTWSSTYKCKQYYRYIQMDSSSGTTAAGECLVYADTDNIEIVTNDFSDVANNSTQGAGFAAAAHVLSGWGWMQIGGVVNCKTNDEGDIAAGDTLYPDSSATKVDGAVDCTAYGTAPVFIPIGVALAADVDGNGSHTVVARIINCYP